MKKLFKFSLFALLFAIVMPFTLFLTGCGATPANEALGVFFESQTYDEETGLAVFAVDKNVNTKLEYKVNPSSWGAYAVTYAIKECSPQNRSRFTLEDGKIKVESDLFEDIKVEIHINNYIDTCIVKLKHYPTSMFLLNDAGEEVNSIDVRLNAFGSYTINPCGRFLEANGTSYVQSLKEYDYNFTVTSSDVTVIQVPHENRLKISSERGQVGSAKVKVELKDATNTVIQTVEVNVTVVLNAGNSMVLLDGCGSFVKNGSNVELKASDLEKDAKNNLIVGYEMFVLSTDGRYIPQESVTIECTTSDGKNITLDNENSRFLVEPTGNAEHAFEVSLWTNLIDNEGQSYSITFNVVVKY